MIGKFFSVFVDGTSESRNAAREEWRKESSSALAAGEITQQEHNEWMCSLARADAEDAEDADDDDGGGGGILAWFGA